MAFGAVFLARTSFFVGSQRYFALFDDSMISMRYARNLAHGHGLVWNTVGHPVEGYSNFLWTLWMAFVNVLPVPQSKTSLVVGISGIGLLVLNLILVRALAAQLAPTSTRVRSLAVWLVALYYPIAYWTLRGMEVGLLAVLGTGAALLAVRATRSSRLSTGTIAGLGAVLALGLLTRDDFLVPAVLITGWVIQRARPSDRLRVIAILGGFVVGTVALHTGFRLVYYGDWLPNTYYLKLGNIGLKTRLHRGIFGLAGVSEVELWAPLALAGAYLLVRRRKVPAGAWLLTAIFAGSCAYSAYVGGDAWESNLLANRYLASQASLLLILTAVAIDCVATVPARVRSQILGLASLVAIPVVLMRVGNVIPASNMQLGPPLSEWWLTRVGTPLVAGAGLVALAGWGWGWLRRLPLKPLVIQTTLLLLVLVAMSNREFRSWDQHNVDIHPSNNFAAVGVRLSAVTQPGAVIAVGAAGSYTYFSNRNTVDLLGVVDRTVAREPPVTPLFIPGHDKGDLSYSVGRLRPDLVIWNSSTSSSRVIESFGYDPVGTTVFVRHDSRLVDRVGVARLAPSTTAAALLQ